LGNRFEESQLWGNGLAALGNSFGEEHIWGATLGSNFGELSGTALRNSFEEQQLLGTHLQGTSGSSFQ
jgi:hypothetical protein